MFNQSVDEKYRYKLNLKISISESKKIINYQLDIGHGMPNVGQKYEFYFTHVNSSKIKDASLADIKLIFEAIESVIKEEFKANLFRVAEYEINITYEKINPFVCKKFDITSEEAIEFFKSMESECILNCQSYISSTKCPIL